MGDFYYSFQEYSTAIEYYKLALASGLLKDFDTNLQTAKCFEKLGDLENAELYYKISMHVNSKSKAVMKKINEYESAKHPDETAKEEKLKYKYLFKDKAVSESEKTENEAEDIIDSINGMF
jgi:tetratricopeptide (TPR) repeat protein